MIPILLFALIVIDFVLVYAFIRLSKRQDEHQKVMREMTEERQMLLDLRSNIQRDLQAAQTQVRSMKDQVQVLAAEAEQEVKNGVATISGEVEAVLANLAGRFEEPLNQLTNKQHYLENLLQRLQIERQNIARTTERAGALAKFFKEGVKFDEVMKDLEDKKFADIRALAARGLPLSRIASDLGISESEVRLVSKLK